ncbi:MAG TPA: hypothetical protein DHV08_00710 [Rhodocyclaceae bacterium]|nr:MAG: hypothetical protein AUK49_08725 [Betaproteobacteria bacterium CG2_30_68_42]PIV73937.1 MAG: hypothetical protein COW56_05745 [Rhodocyclales bacterium CG17_big_fil_post_rev_8_21_14_2_50_68_7]PIX75453.1 MAG: hypothetical protein COZ38_05545 [Rhodocyclales bacterium CG_4_10_14_3_um_filter_68_10]PJA58470.1 MAG: hypothetical protein CO164_02340 [Rhodocyclales bacterium CG_4_9_14_3_um_filter_68_10]HCX32198.1 hypothetical protein [Rhodocyclaceae bacterium]
MAVMSVRRHLAGLAQAAMTVFSALFGIRRGVDHERQTRGLHPAYLAIAILIAVISFVIVLLAIVRAVTSH